jgi:hypothetical protein
MSIFQEYTRSLKNLYNPARRLLGLARKVLEQVPQGKSGSGQADPPGNRSGYTAHGARNNTGSANHCTRGTKDLSPLRAIFSIDLGPHGGTGQPQDSDPRDTGPSTEAFSYQSGGSTERSTAYRGKYQA